MKEFFYIMKEYLAPYKKYLAWAVVFNLLSAVLNIFSFASLIPILNMLFNIDNTSYGMGQRP